MRTDVPAPADPTLQSRTATVTLYPTASPRDLIVGTPDLDTRDLTPYVTSARHTAAEATIAVSWHSDLDGAAFPVPGQLVRVSVGPYAVFTGHLDAISGVRVARDGTKTATLTARRRDATKWWRDIRRVTQIFTVGVDLASIARDVAANLGLTAEEFVLPDVGVVLAHDTAQLADLNGWDMLTLCLAPGLREPLVDARGVLKALDRNVRRPADLVIPLALVKEIGSGLTRAPLSCFRAKWQNPKITEVTASPRIITRGPVTLTCGFFNESTFASVRWSEDGSLKARDTRLINVKTAGGGLLTGGSISMGFRQDSPDGGTMTLSMDVGGGLAEIATDIAVALGAAGAKDLPGVGAFLGGIFGGIEMAAICDALRVITQTAVGSAEVTGTPYTLVHEINETEAYDQDAEEWRVDFQEEQNDLIPSQEVASAYAVNELIYRAKSASRSTLVIADDLRIEQGDMVGIEDGSRFYVGDLSRDLTRGGDALLALDGFFA